MYRLFQANTDPPRHDNGDDEAVNPLPAPFYGDTAYYSENQGIPLQVSVPNQPIGDEPSALDDGSAMAYQRQFEDLWRALEQEAIRNGWTHIEPGHIQDVINNNLDNLEMNNGDGAGDDDDEDEATEWGINSIPPNIIDPGYGDLGRTNTNATNNNINHAVPQSAPVSTLPNHTNTAAAARRNIPPITQQMQPQQPQSQQPQRNTFAPPANNFGGANRQSTRSEHPFSSQGLQPSFESSNNETPIHANYNRWETEDMNPGSDQPSIQVARNRRARQQRQQQQQQQQQQQEQQQRVTDNVPLHEPALLPTPAPKPAPPSPPPPPPPPPAERPSLDDDPGPQLLQTTRRKAPPPPPPASAPAVAAAAAAAPSDDASSFAETEIWQTIPAGFFDEEQRARFISAGIIKPKNTNLGLDLKSNRDGGIEIERIASNGFLSLAGTPLKVGDLITGIRTSKASYTCGHIGGMRKNEIQRLLKRTSGRITIIAENPTGDTERIECMTSKPHPEFGTGIFFLSGSPGSKILQIHSVPSNGLFANSLLHRGARVISINGVDCTELDACVATDIVKSAPMFVSIVAESTRGGCSSAVVDQTSAALAATHLGSVPEASTTESSGTGDGQRSSSSFGGIFRRRSGNRMEGGSDHSPRSVDC